MATAAPLWCRSQAAEHTRRRPQPDPRIQDPQPDSGAGARKSALRGEDRTRQRAYRTTQTGRFPRTIRPRALPHAAQGREGLYHQIIGLDKNEGAATCRSPFVFVPAKVYTSPEKPMKAMARMPAVTSAIGVPRNDSGTSSNSNRSRIPAKSTSASAKPRAVETE